MTYPEFKARYALTPDPQQEAAILRAEGPTLLLAVPGSGKTTTLVTRLGYLIHCLGVEPGRTPARWPSAPSTASASPSSPTTPGPRGRSLSLCGPTRGS